MLQRCLLINGSQWERYSWSGFGLRGRREDLVLNRLRGVLGAASSLLALRLVGFEFDVFVGGIFEDEATAGMAFDALAGCVLEDEATVGVAFGEAWRALAFFGRSVFNVSISAPIYSFTDLLKRQNCHRGLRAICTSSVIQTLGLMENYPKPLPNCKE